MFLKQMEIVVDKDKIHVDIQKVLMERKTIKKWAYILHDKDDTRDHYHIYINFGGSSLNTLVQRAKIRKRKFLSRLVIVMTRA